MRALKEIPFRSFLPPLLLLLVGCDPEPGLEGDLTAVRERELVGDVLVPEATVTKGRGRLVPVPDAVVFLASEIDLPSQLPKEPVVAEVKDLKVNPPFSCVLVGQRFIIRPVDQRRYYFKLFARTVPRIGEIMPRESDEFEQVFHKPDLSGSFACAIHPTVRGHVASLPNHVFTRTGEDGSFALPFPLPPGEYELVAFHPSHGKATHSPDTRAGPLEPLTFTLPVPGEP